MSRTTAEARTLVACVLAAVAASLCHAAPPKYDKSLVAELSDFLDASPNVAQVRNDGFDTKRWAEHSRWATDLVDRSTVFVGTGSAAERMGSPYFRCVDAAYWGRTLWQERMGYAVEPTQARRAAVEQWRLRVQDALSQCKRAGGSR